MWWDYGGPMPWFGMMLWPVVMIGFMIVCALIMMLFMRGSGMGMPWGRDRRGSAPFDILRERLARGDIDKAEYEERKRLLSQP